MEKFLRNLRQASIRTILWLIAHRRPISAVACIVVPQFNPNLNIDWLRQASEVTW